MNPAPLRRLQVMGPWHRLHRAESETIAGLLSTPERDAVNRRLSLRPRNQPPAWIPPRADGEGSRFCEPLGPGALYLGNELPTCLAEVAHHHARHCAASLGTPPGSRAVLRHLIFQVSGTLADATAAPRGGLHDPSTHVPSWAYGRQARAEGLQGVHYRSVRRRGGRCLAIFEERAVRFLRSELGAVILEWDGSTSRRIA